MLTPLEHQWKRNAVNLLKRKAEKVEVFLNLSKKRNILPFPDFHDETNIMKIYATILFSF